MDHRSQCSFCLYPVQTTTAITDVEDKEIQQNIFECNKKLLNEDVGAATVLNCSNSVEFLPLFCPSCFQTALNIFQIHQDLEKIRENLKSLVKTFRCEIKIRASKISKISDQIKIENDVEVKEETFSDDEFDDSQAFTVDPASEEFDNSPGFRPEETDFPEGSEIAITNPDDYKNFNVEALEDPEYITGEKSSKINSIQWPRVMLERLQVDKDGRVLYSVAKQVNDGVNLEKWTTAGAGIRKIAKSSISDYLSGESAPRLKRNSVWLNRRTKAHTSRSPLDTLTKVRKTKDGKYWCDICGKPFKDNEVLKWHRLTHRGAHERPTEVPKIEGEEYCYEIDGRDVKDNDVLKKHRVVNRNPHKKKTFPRTIDGKFCCDICGRPFRDSYAIKRHRVIHRGAHERSSEVPKIDDEEYCDEIYGRDDKDNDVLKKHRMTNRNSHGKPTYPRTVDGKFCCDICGRPFRDSYVIKRHRVTHRDLHEKPSESLEQKYRLKLQLKKKAIKTGTEMEQCDVCGKILQKNNMQRHLNEFHANGNFLCLLCGNSLGSKRRLLRHEKRCGKMKTDVKMCRICGKQFSHKGNLEKHLLTHSNEKPFICEVCGMGFSQLVNLTKHMFVHTGNRPRPFKCTQCEKAFFDKHRLQNHVLVHTGERPHACAFCDKTFADRSTRRKHQLTHKQNT